MGISPLLDLEAKLVARTARREQPVAVLAAEVRHVDGSHWIVGHENETGARVRRRRMRRAAFNTGNGHFSPRTSISSASSIKRSLQPALAMP